MSNLCIDYLSYLSPTKQPASLDLEPGLNVICGASETGKSLIVETIDFMFGGKDPVREIPERKGYDRIRMLIHKDGFPPLELERSIEGGHFSAFDEELRGLSSEKKPVILRAQHSAARNDTLSYHLLERMGFIEKRLRKNAAGETRTISARDLIRLALVTEEEIQRRSSPLLSGQWVQATPEYATFKLLLTQTDDSALASLKKGIVVTSDSLSGKIELLDELISEIDRNIQEKGLDEIDLKDQLRNLDKSISDQNNVLINTQDSFNKLVKKQGAAANELKNLIARQAELKELTERFNLLDSSYSSDLNRLKAIQESGSIFVHLKRDSCPLCGALSDDQHLDEKCDGNIEQYVVAANSEIKKITKLQSELKSTIGSLANEDGQIASQITELQEVFKKHEKELSAITKPSIQKERNLYNNLLELKLDVKSSLAVFERKQQLTLQKEALEQHPNKEKSETTTQTSVPKSSLDSYSQTVERILQDWNFPNASRVFFDEIKKDIQISGKERGSYGKGLRAITHAAMNIGLLEYCLENELPHPGFLILDSPLLAYWKPEGQEDDLRGTDLKERFYKYLLGLKSGIQIIIIENEHPPAFVSENGNVVVFTKNPHQGRYGFFPYAKN